SPHGDIFVNNNLGQQIVNPGVQDNGEVTFLHEYGHALGLEHPGGDGRNPEYTEQDTVMSYLLAPNQPGVNPDSAEAIHPITPMVLDIQAIQQLYGANLHTRTEGDTYFGPALPGTTQVYPFGDHADTMLTIWDAGGDDTVSAENQSDNA